MATLLILLSICNATPNLTSAASRLAPLTDMETALVAQAMTCKYGRHPYNRNRELAETLIRLERGIVPPPWRGISLAAACREAGFNPHAVGDGGAAVGVMQQHGWWTRRYPKLNRWDPVDATRTWLRHVALIARTKASRCGGWAWRVAEQWVSRGGRRPDCTTKGSRHWTLLMTWHRNISLNRVDLANVLPYAVRPKSR